MSIRAIVTLECDQKNCHAELVRDAADADINEMKHGTNVEFYADGWRQDDDGNLWCPDCAGAAEDDERDEAYERAAARARNNDFAETGGKDWT